MFWMKHLEASCLKTTRRDPSYLKDILHRIQFIPIRPDKDLDWDEAVITCNIFPKTMTELNQSVTRLFGSAPAT